MNDTVLVTGASRGIGRECARQFALAGYNVAVNFLHDEASADSLVREIDQITGRCNNILTIKADVRKREEVDEMFFKIKETLGSPSVLVNNAGISQQKVFSDITDSDWNNIFSTNVTGTFHCIQAALPHMIHEKRGRIINISSIWGLSGASCEVHYSASKAAVIGLTKALAKELGPSGIRVNCVAPGVVNTDMNSDLTEDTLSIIKTDTPLNVLGTPADIANTVLFLASSKADFITGQIISPNGGFLI